MYKSIKKRDGRTVKFDRKKIEKAIEKAGLETGEFDAKQAVKLKIWRRRQSLHRAGARRFDFSIAVIISLGKSLVKR